MTMIRRLRHHPGWVIIAVWLILTGCRAESLPTPMPVEINSLVDSNLFRLARARSVTPQPITVYPEPAEGPPPTITPAPTNTATRTPTATATASPTATPTPIGSCEIRSPENDLLAVVTLDYRLSRDYKPPDLMPLSDWLPQNVTLGYPTEVRRDVLQPLISMIEDMQAEGLSPQVISGYRSYAAQAIAWNKWNDQYPEHASIISAPPGHSEHQLGTAVDFGSPELAEVVGQEDIEFHTLFYKTSEGAWLIENAHKYGFTLSYPLEAFDLTGFYYEPWHYRYVGLEMAGKLNEMGMSLTEYQLLNQDAPCIP